MGFLSKLFDKVDKSQPIERRQGRIVSARKEGAAFVIRLDDGVDYYLPRPLLEQAGAFRIDLEPGAVVALNAAGNRAIGFGTVHYDEDEDVT